MRVSTVKLIKGPETVITGFASCLKVSENTMLWIKHHNLRRLFRRGTVSIFWNDMSKSNISCSKCSTIES